MEIKAVLFDVDGTLINTHEYIYQSFEYSLAKFHEPLGRDIIQTIMGKPLEECYQILTKLTDVSELSKYHTQFQKEHPELVEPFPNTVSTLEWLKEQGFLIAAVTTRAKNTVQETLAHTGVINYVNYIITIDDVELPKPSPEGIQKALTYFEIQPQHAIMVGDTDVDVIAGKNAKTKTIGVTYGFQGEKIKETDPDFVINDIREVIDILDKQ